MKILAIETSCDETAVAVTQGTEVLSSVKITQAVHAQWGGVVPSLAKRDHEANIDWVIEKALSEAGFPTLPTGRQVESGMTVVDSAMQEIDAIAVTQGPGLAIALGVGIAKAKELVQKYAKPLVAVNHVEGHILSALVHSDNFKFKILNLKFPAAAVVVSGGHTQVILVKQIGEYQILAESLDDDIGEAIDKGARMLGLPYPGGPALEQLAKLGNPKTYPLPLPMARREGDKFSYAGLKTALYRLVQKLTSESVNQVLTEKQKQDLAAAYQARIFEHLVRITRRVIEEQMSVLTLSDLLVGGGVAANQDLRSRIDDLGEELGLQVHYPENLVLCTDNAAMIGVVGGFKAARGEYATAEELDRKPRWRVDNL